MLRVLVLFLVLVSIAAAAGDTWKDLRFLLGDWTGEGGGGAGAFSFELQAGGKAMLRRNSADYPASSGKPSIHHEDIMLIYADADGQPPKAVYVDSEGHVIQYETSLA